MKLWFILDAEANVLATMRAYNTEGNALDRMERLMKTGEFSRLRVVSRVLWDDEGQLTF